MKNPTILVLVLLITCKSYGQDMFSTHAVPKNKLFPNSYSSNHQPNSLQQLDSIEYQTWASDIREYVRERHCSYKYFNNHKISIKDSIYYHNYGNTMYEGFRYYYGYNNHQDVNQIVVMYQNLNDLGWKYHTKYQYTYDSQNRLNQMYYIVYDPNTSQWMDNYRAIYYYDSDNMLDSIIGLSKDFATMKWMLSSKNTFTYYPNNLINVQEGFYYDNPLQQWVLAQKEDRDYLVNNELKQISWSEYEQTGALKHHNKTVYVYDNFGLIDTTLFMDWDIQQGVFDIVRRTTFEQNTFNDITQIKSENNTINGWINSELISNSFNTSVSVSEVVYPYAIPHNRQIVEIIRNGWQNPVWAKDQKRLYHYSNFSPNNIARIETIKTKSFPNPARNLINLLLPSNSTKSEVLVYGMKGDVVLATILNVDNQMDISTLPKGTYHFKVKTEHQVYHGSFVKVID